MNHRDLTAEAEAARNLYYRARRAYLETMSPAHGETRRSEARERLRAAALLVNRTRLGTLVTVALLALCLGVSRVQADPLPYRHAAKAPKPAKLSYVCPNGTVGKSYTELPAPEGQRRAVLVCIVDAKHPVNTYHYKVKQEGQHCYGTVDVCEGGDCWIQPVSFVCP